MQCEITKEEIMTKDAAAQQQGSLVNQRRARAQYVLSCGIASSGSIQGFGGRPPRTAASIHTRTQHYAIVDLDVNSLRGSLPTNYLPNDPCKWDGNLVIPLTRYCVNVGQISAGAGAQVPSSRNAIGPLTLGVMWYQDAPWPHENGHCNIHFLCQRGKHLVRLAKDAQTSNPSPSYNVYCKY